MKSREIKKSAFIKQLFFTSTLKELGNKNNFLVHLDGYNAIVRNNDGEEIGELSESIANKIIKSGKVKFTGKGSGILNHEKYYKLDTKHLTQKETR